ncbi:MAG: hypothetical protein K5912_00290 [Alphaproteobacteria bacterium]|nr:hypothetical protein [Alphaproteobacteria bacterium]
MKQKIVSGLGIFLVLPALAGARLPAVNVAAGSVSARAEFGDVPVQKKTNANIVKKSDTVAPAPKRERRVVARSAKKSIQKDTGDKIVQNAEFLIPNRPSSDLWAKNDTPLRMPRADEFSVISSNDTLPEENISGAPVKIAHTDYSIEDLAVQTSALDAQIARLIELQRQAEASVKSNKKVASAKVSRASVAPTVITSEPYVETFSEPTAKTSEKRVESFEKTTELPENNVRLARMVVPRQETVDDDVIIRPVQKNRASKIQTMRDDMTKLSPAELRRAFRKTFLSENKHLSTYSFDDRFDVASDMSSSIEGFTAERDLSEDTKIRPLEIKIKFRNSDSALSRENYNLLSEYAGIVVSNPKRAIQISIPAEVTTTADGRKLAARRLAIVEQVLRDTGVSEQRIVPVLSQRNDEGFLLRIISNEQYESLTRQKRNMFGDTVGSKTYKSMSW